MSVDEEAPTVGQLTGLDEQPDSLLDQLAAKVEQSSEVREVDIPVSAHSMNPPVLMVRYRLLAGDELQTIANKVIGETSNKWERNIRAGVDTLIAACVDIRVSRTGTWGESEPLQYQGQPVNGFTEELALALRFRQKIATSASRDVAFGLFGNNEVALATHCAVLNRWFGDTTINVWQEMMEGNL